MNVPVPPIFLYEYDLARFEVMDGRQRLTALMEFYGDAYELTELQYWPELDGRTYSDLPASIRDGIDRRYLSSIILLNETAATEDQAASLKKMVFERLNSGGVRLSGQETRNAVFNGPLNDLCLRLSRVAELRTILGTPLDSELELVTASDSSPDEIELTDSDQDSESVKATNIGQKMYESMEDVEIVLRFFAYRHFDRFPQGLNRISEFLDKFLARGNKFPSSTFGEYEQLFLDNIKFWFEIGGATAFQVKGSNRHFSKIAYDALMYASSALTALERQALLGEPLALQTALVEMYEDHGADFGGRRTNSADARRRNKHAFEALTAALSSLSE